ncbi:hypothetical protein [Qipengyuania sp. MTN3-11]|uniref:F0F1 ATP synthase subunit B family protein n=1 Tax=Qipengyuania sp. MTN3-11 TaxID=3056557 RepID=UPI0036F2ECCB
MALPSIVEETPTAHTADGGYHPELLGLAAEGWVYASITIFFLIAFFGFKVHRTIAEKLDAQIAETRKSLDEAERYRKEAEALLEDARRQQAESARDAEAMLANARNEAGNILAQAETDSKALVERRQRMAEDTIAAAEREAVQDVRNRAAMAATLASRKLIAGKHDAKADKALADQLIASL